MDKVGNKQDKRMHSSLEADESLWSSLWGVAANKNTVICSATLGSSPTLLNALKPVGSRLGFFSHLLLTFMNSEMVAEAAEGVRMRLVPGKLFKSGTQKSMCVRYF